MKNYINITSRYLKVQMKRTILTIVGIILSVALITGIGTIIVSMRASMIQDAIKETGDYHAMFSRIETDKVNKIQNHVDVVDSSLVIREEDAVLAPVSKDEIAGNIEKPPYRYLVVNGYDQKAFDMFSVPLKEGRLPQSPNEIAIESWALEYLPKGTGIGDTIKLDFGQRKDKETGVPMQENTWSATEVFEKTGEKEYTIVGLIRPRFISSVNFFASGITFADSSQFEKGQKANVYVKLNSVRGVQEKIQAIAQDVGLSDAGSIQYNEKLLRLSAQSLNGTLNDSMRMVLAFIVGLVILSTIAVIYNAFHISVLERISQFGILRCVGASPAQIRRIVLREAFILSAIGIPLGIASGFFAMKIVFYVIGLIDGGNTLGNMPVTVSWAVIAISIVLGLVTVFLSAYGPARQAGKVSPLEAVRNTGNLKKEHIKRSKRSWFPSWLFGMEGKMAWKNLRRNRKRFVITVFSMVISIVLYITFGSFIDFSFKMGVVDQTEKGDFTAWTYSPGFTPEEYDELNNLPGVDTVYKYMNASARILVPESKVVPRFKELRPEFLSYKEGEDIVLFNNQIISYGSAGLDELKKALKSGKIDPAAMNQENGVLLIKTGKLYDEKGQKSVLVDVADYKVGDTIKVSLSNVPDTENNIYKTVKVMGIVEKGILNDQYNQNGGMLFITTEEVFQKITEVEGYYRVYIKLQKGADKEPVSEYLKDQADTRQGFGYTDFAEAAKAYRNGNIIMSIFLYGFIAVISLIGCLNIINTISTNLILRTRELSMLKAVGMTQNGVKKMVGLESLFYGLIAAFYGGILGTLLSYGLYQIVMRVREFQWTIPWNQIVIAVAGAAVIALLSGYFPLKRINKGIIIENIRMEE